MQPQKRGIAQRVGAWSAAHRKTAILGWIGFVVAALLLGGSIGTNELTNAESTPGEAGVAEKALDEAGLQPASEMVFLHSDKLKATDPPFESAIAEVSSKLQGLPAVKRIGSPSDGGGAISDDQHSALVQFEIKGDPNTAADRVDPIIEGVGAVAADHPDLRIEQFGGASADKALSEAFEKDLQKAETLSLPITLLILVIAFGALVAAGVPLLLGDLGRDGDVRADRPPEPAAAGR